MDPAGSTPGSAPPRLPRADGDGPAKRIAKPKTVAAPPCRRGWTRVACAGFPSGRGSPVQTGMDPSWRVPSSGVAWLPRADGDGPLLRRHRLARVRAPPCRRGWTAPPPQRHPHRRGSPVQTGMDRGERYSVGAQGRLPRADGDGPPTPLRVHRVSEAPPCRRGWTPVGGEPGQIGGGSPCIVAVVPVDPATSLRPLLAAEWLPRIAALR